MTHRSTSNGETYHIPSKQEFTDPSLEQTASAETVKITPDTFGELIKTAKTSSEAAALSWVGILVDTKSKLIQRHPELKQLDMEQLASFGEILTVEAQSDLEDEMKKGYTGITVGVDYSPDELLDYCADEAGLKAIKWPPKTFVWVTPTEVTVSRDESKFEKVWPAPVEKEASNVTRRPRQY